VTNLGPAGLSVDRPSDGVALVTIRGQDKVNSLNEQDHLDLGAIWPTLAQDKSVRIIVITGEGNYFCAGGNMGMEQRLAGDYQGIVQTMTEARDLVMNILNCDKPIISAINGPAAGAGLATALLADISIVGDDVPITDGHTRIGLAAGDHAALIWPLLCGMARAKYYLLTCDRLDGRTAADIGLVSRSVPREEVLKESLDLAARLAAGPQHALRWTKRSLNQWLRMAGPTFEASLGLEMINLFGPDYLEGITAFIEKREPVFDQTITQEEQGNHE
jgi:enoyl-CoA hydratase